MEIPLGSANVNSSTPSGGSVRAPGVADGFQGLLAGFLGGGVPATESPPLSEVSLQLPNGKQAVPKPKSSLPSPDPELPQETDATLRDENPSQFEASVAAWVGASLVSSLTFPQEMSPFAGSVSAQSDQASLGMVDKLAPDNQTYHGPDQSRAAQLDQLSSLVDPNDSVSVETWTPETPAPSLAEPLFDRGRTVKVASATSKDEVPSDREFHQLEAQPAASVPEVAQGKVATSTLTDPETAPTLDQPVKSTKGARDKESDLSVQSTSLDDGEVTDRKDAKPVGALTTKNAITVDELTQGSASEGSGQEGRESRERRHGGKEEHPLAATPLHLTNSESNPVPSKSSAPSTVADSRDESISRAEQHLSLRQVAQKMETAAALRSREGIVVKLNTAEVGEISFSIRTSKEGGVEAKISTTHDQLSEALRGNQTLLNRQLAEQGFRHSEVSVYREGFSGQPRHRPNPPFAFESSTFKPSGSVGDPVPTAIRVGKSHGIDLWI